EYVASALLLLLVRDKKWQEAGQLCDEASSLGMSAALVAAYRARVKFAQGLLDTANEGANESLSALSEGAPADEVRWIAQLLSDLGRHADAFPLRNRIASRSALTADTK